MKLTKNEWLHTGRWIGQWLIVMCLMGIALGGVASAQAVSTTTVQGTVYLANGGVGAGTLDVSWPAFTTSNSQAITAGRVTVTIGQDGFVSVNLAPNLGATPAGLYYTAIYHMNDGTTSTEYWVVPASAQASLGQVRAQLMPSAQAVQAVSKAYVDQSITELTQSLLTASGGTLSGPLYLNGDPTQALQAADKHYVDSDFGLAVPLAGGSMTGALATPTVNGVQTPVAGSTQTTIQAAVSAAGTGGAVQIPPTYTGSDGFTNPNGVYVTDLRQKGAQQFERSVKEFGAVCDGTTDDTNALQAALNYAQTHGVALTIPQGTCKTHMLSWRGESIGGMGKQVSALMGFPGQDVLATATDSTNLLANTRLHDLTIYVDQSMDVSCSAAEGRAPAGSCAMSRLLESNSIFSPSGNGLTGTAGTGAAWAVGNCAIAMPAATGAGGNGLRVAEIENLEIAATGTDPMAQYTGAHSTHTCGLYLAQWPQWSEFRNIDIRGLNTGIALPALPGTTPAGLNADSNRWQNITIQATHGYTAAAGSNNVLDNVVVSAANSAATGEPPTGLVLDLTGTQQGWTVRNAVVLPAWNVVTPTLTVTAAGGAVTAVTAGVEKGLGFDPYGITVPLKFSGSCTAAAAASVNRDGSIGTISVTQGGVGCSGTTTASVNVDGTWDTAAPVNLIAGQNMTLFGGNLQKGNGGYTVWNAAGSRSSGTMLGGGGGTLPGGGSYTGLVANSSLGSASQVDQFPGTDFGAKLQACLVAISATYGGTCDARNFTGNLSMASNLTVSTANVTVLLPCATISTASQVIVTAGTRNVTLRGCALRGASATSGSQGGTVFLYSGTGAMVQVGDPTYAADTMGFHLDNVVINTTVSSSAGAQGLAAYRTQEMDLESLYFLGNQNQTGMTLDGTGNYTGGTFFDDAFNGFQTAVNAIGHQTSNAATTDWMNASAFVRLHIDCPTSAGNPINGTYGINLQQGDGNTFTGGDVESCATALHLGANAQNNTIIGLRNENSTNQVVADAGSSYNNWMTGGTMFTGQLTDNGTRNSFMDTFHRSFNGIKGDWYGSQQDATVTNHYRIGIGAGNERGLLNRYQTDYGYRWTTGLSDATAGEQFYQVLDELNNVNRLSIGQYNNGQSSTNNQTVINAAGTGAIVLNGSNNAGTGGVIIGSGGASESTVATINNAGNALFNGTLQVGGPSTFIGSTTVKNQADAEIDQILWAGATANQKESYTYKDYAGSSQWYMVKDANNNWALNSATGGLDSFKAYQSGNSGDTYVNTSNSSGVIRLNYESGSSGKTYIYAGSSSSLIAAFSGTTAISFPGLKSSSGYSCLQIDNSGYISNTGSACGTSSITTNGTVGTGNAGQIAYYSTSGTAISGTSAVPVTAGGTGAATATGALASLGAQATIPGLSGDGKTNPGIQVSGNVTAGTLKGKNLASIGPRYDVTQFGAAGDGSTDDTAAIQAAFDTCWNTDGSFPAGGIVEFPGPHTYVISSTIMAHIGCSAEGILSSSMIYEEPPVIQWNGSAVSGAVSNITQFSVAQGTGLYLATATFTVDSSPAVGSWVVIQGLSTGVYLNRVVAQVLSTGWSTTQFSVSLPFNWTTVSTTADTGTATTTSVMLAFGAPNNPNNSAMNYAQNLTLKNASGLATASQYGVGILYMRRADAGTRISNVWTEGSSLFGLDFSAGGINAEVDRATRFDGYGQAGIYWHVGSNDGLGIANGTFTSTAPGQGAPIMLDSSNCGLANGMHFTARNIKIENNLTMASGYGTFTLLDCPSNTDVTQFYMDMENVWVVAVLAANAPAVLVSPANDEALQLTISNGQLYTGGTAARFVGVPSLSRYDMAGSSGYIPFLSYSPSLNSFGLQTNQLAFRAPIQLNGDVNLGQLFQYGIPASALLYSDTSYASLPNGTTLVAGQVLAPPAYWSGASGKRYALDVVYQTGTTGTPNSGATTCTSDGATRKLTCSSAADLSTGQRISIGSATNLIINYVDATNPTSVAVWLTTTPGTISTASTLSFNAPVLGPELQMPTKSSAVPTTLTWAQGDWEQNSGAAANGIAAWVNVATGTPGTWAAVPLGNSSGQLSISQVTGGTQSALPVCPNGAGGTLTTAGCSSTGVAAPSTVAYLSKYVANTGSTAMTQVASLTIPASALTSTGKLAVTVQTSACSGSTTPYTSCTAANTGTCSVNAYFTSTNTGMSNHYLSVVVPAKGASTSRLNIRAQGSTNSQVLSADLTYYSSAVAGPGSISNPTSVNMTNASYINVFLTNSVSTDTCFLDQADILLLP